MTGISSKLELTNIYVRLYIDENGCGSCIIDEQQVISNPKHHNFEAAHFSLLVCWLPIWVQLICDLGCLFAFSYNRRFFFVF